MIERLIDWSARHRFAVLALTAIGAALGWRSLTRMPLDALPDTGDTQVIVHAEWDRSADLLDAQVTTPIVSALMGAPRVRSVRGLSDYGSSTVYVTFDDGTDLYWARARTLELLSTVTRRLPPGATAGIGPDATALGWVFQYALIDRTGAHDLQELRALQDWTLKDQLRSVPGVAEVATVGGFVRQFQINVDPNRLRAYGLSLQGVAQAVRNGNGDVGGRVVDEGGRELIVRGLGSAVGVSDLERIPLGEARDGTAIRVADVAHVVVGSDLRRGVADLDGMGEAVSGIVVMRHGENAREVIERVKERIRRIESWLPPGVQIVPVYDRSDLIRRSVDQLTHTILEVMVVVSIVILLFLWHAPSTAVPLVTLPAAVLIAFLPIAALGIGANIMSLSGIAIAVGALVDAAIVVVEQTHKRLEEWDRDGRVAEPRAVILGAIHQVGRPAFFALLVIAVSFLPVLALEGEAGRLFRPLALAKSAAMIVAAVLAITLDPALRLTFMRVTPFRLRSKSLTTLANAALVGTLHREGEHPITKRLMRLYEPVVVWSVAHKRLLFSAAALSIVLTVPLWRALGTEFMPPFDEGTLLYMPSTIPGISMEEAERLLEVTDRVLAGFPEVERVLGKAGRADTATDPAPVSMLETVVVLKPPDTWPRRSTWYGSWAPGWLRGVLRHVTPEHASREELIARMDAAVTLPGVANSWTMPVRGRLDMLSTGIRTPLGLKITGADVTGIESIGAQVATLLRSVPGTRGVFAEQVGRVPYLDVRWDLSALTRAGVTLEDAQAAVRYALGGEDVATIYSGRERDAVRVMYPRALREDVEALGRILVTSADGRRHLPIAALAAINTTSGPSMLRNEDGLLTGYVYVDIADDDVPAYVERADRLLRERVTRPRGGDWAWAGRYEAIAKMKRQLWEIVPLTLLIIVALLYASTRSWTKTAIVLLAVPCSAFGAVLALWILGYHVSAAVWVGLIALLGVDAETGVFMLLYLDEAFDRAKRENRLDSPAALTRAVVVGAARRLRPKLMTAVTMFFGLLPILWSNGTGSDVMKRIAAPLIGGIVTSFLLELLLYPAIYHAWKSRLLFGRVTAR